VEAARTKADLGSSGFDCVNFYVISDDCSQVSPLGERAKDYRAMEKQVGQVQEVEAYGICDAALWGGRKG
jgi:hypothetical protein